MQKEITYNGNTVLYNDQGEGQPVILIHGFGEDSQVWDVQVNVLKDICRVLVPDLPGCGHCVLGEGEWSIEDFADIIKNILVAEEIATAVIIGHSMGGYITLAFAEAYPDCVQAFGLFHSSAYADNDEKKTSRQRSIDFIRTHGSYEFLKQSTPNLFSDIFKDANPGYVNNFIEKYKDFDPEALAAQTKAMMERPDRTEVLRKFAGPVLFIVGRHDKAVPFDLTMQQVHLPRLSYIHILENSAHMGMLEEPLKSNEFLQEFVKSIK